MKSYYFETEQFLPISIQQAWEFFSSPENLKLITPERLDFQIQTRLNDEEIYEGMIIDYRVRPLFGVAVGWTTEICHIDKPYSFTDRQIKGPYRFWLHRHEFIEKEGGILMKDKVSYALNFGGIGRLVHYVLVKKKIREIFDYRRKVLEKKFENLKI